MTARARRKLLLLAILVMTALVWTELSVASPFVGWARMFLAKGMERAYRLTAAAVPCSPCDPARVSIQGITFTYPAILDRHWNVESDSSRSLSAFDRRERCALVFHVSTLPAEKAARFRDLWLQKQVVVEQRHVHGWEVVIVKARPPATASAVVCGGGRVIVIDALVDGRLISTRLSRWVEREFLEVVERVCAENPVHRPER